MSDSSETERVGTDLSPRGNETNDDIDVNSEADLWKVAVLIMRTSSLYSGKPQTGACTFSDEKREDVELILKWAGNRPKIIQGPQSSF